MLNLLAENTTMCGGMEVPNTLINLVALIIRGFKIVVPILLIIFGMLDFAKSIVAKKEDDIKKYRNSFVARLISAVLVFFVVTIVQLVVGLLGTVEKESNGSNSDNASAWECTKKFINGIDLDDSTDESTSVTKETTD